MSQILPRVSKLDSPAAILTITQLMETLELDTAQLVENTADDLNGGEDDVKEAIRKVQEGLRDAQTKHGGC